MEIKSLKIQLLDEVQLILAQSHFIKTVEDVSECLVNCVPGIKFGCGFCEASGPCLVRHAGNDDVLEKMAMCCIRKYIHITRKIKADIMRCTDVFKVPRVVGLLKMEII